MKFKLHNKLLLKTNNSTYIFYNEMLPSIFEPLSNLKSYTNFISVGNGKKNELVHENFTLSNYLTTIKTTSKTYQSDLNNGALFSKLEFLIDTKQIKSDYITEIGLSDNNYINPKLYNYFYLIDNNNPNGIDLSNMEEIAIEIYIYLYIAEEPENFLCCGSNPFIEYILGAGLDKIYACRGSNYCENMRINREVPNNREFFECNIDTTSDNTGFILTLNADLKSGETNEILLISSNKVFARYNLKEYKPTISETSTYLPKANYVIDLSNDIKSVLEIRNQSTNSIETNCHISKYANSFGDKVSLPFNNLFNSETQRFVSKDGDKIFFVLDDIVYGYINKNFVLNELNTVNIKIQNIKNIVSFNEYIFIISYTKPYISTFIIKNNDIEQTYNDFETLEFYESINNSRAVDFTQTKSNDFIFGLIDNSGIAYTTYFNLNENKFISTDTFKKEYNFTYLLAMYKNNFCDAKIIYLQGGESSIDSKIVTYDHNKIETDVYSSLAYLFTNNTKEIHTKGRAVIVEKNETPSLLIYYYPQIFKYELPLISNELDDYISNNVNYLIQKIKESEFHIYNLIGYDEPEEFIQGFPEEIDQSKILDFEFLSDTLLIFLNKKDTPIVAYNFNLNKTQIENVSSNENEYNISYEKYNKLGINNEGVVVNLTTKILLWFFQIKFIKLRMEQIFQ